MQIQPTSIRPPRALSGGGKSGGKNTAYTMQRRLNSNKVHEFTLVTGDDFAKHGYRNREDITILPPGVLVLGSYNVVTNTANRIGVVKGFTIDGFNDPTLLGITSSFDFTKVTSNDTHLRTYSTHLQARYINPVSGHVFWITFFDGLVAGNTVNYTSYWDETQLTTVVLFVNQTPNIYYWSAAIASFASATVNTITKMGTQTWAELGFTTTGTVQINDVSYAYTGGTGSTTLTGVSPSPALAGSVGDMVAQSVVINTNQPAANFNSAIIGNLNNQIFVGANDSSILYTSKVNDFTDYTQSTPRLIGDGNQSRILDYPTAFINQDQNLLVSAGKDIWYQTQFDQTTTTISDGGTPAVPVTTIYETLSYQRLKTTAQQSAQSQALTTKIKNNIAFLSFEPIVNSLGTVEDFLNSPQTTDLSYSIVNDMNRYDFTDAAMVYFREFLYLSVPKEGLIRIYNMTNPKIQYWEAPVTYPIARFSIIDDELYGHSYGIHETYKLFNGYTFDGNPIPAAAYLSYQQYGTRTYPKDFNLFYMEGYISPNCDLTYGLNYDIDGCQTQRTFGLSGNNSNNSPTAHLVCTILPDASLGKESLGKRPLSGITVPSSVVTSTKQTNDDGTPFPPKFRAIKQISKFPFYELQIFFESLGSDQQWELIAAGPNVGPATEGPVAIQY